MSKKVLVVDDSLVVRQQIAWALTQAGYGVVQACDGQEGFEKVQATGDFAMIICDVNMPGTDGLQMLSSMKEHGLTRCPIVMLTAEVEPELVQQARSLGAAGWMVKPFREETLVATVDRLTRNSKAPV